MRTKDYYDEFSEWYERERGHGYHRLIDDLEFEVVARYAHGASVLEAGCGTGLLLERSASIAREAVGVDLSSGMLAKARARDLHVLQANITDLPFADERFDVVYSFKVLAHVERIRDALHELHRVTRRGGYLILEFYNPLSLRYLVKRLKPGTAISERTTDHAVFTRYDGLAEVQSYIPVGVRLVTLRGVRIATPFASLHRIRPVGALLRRAERTLADLPLLRRLGGFLVVVAQRT